MPYSDINFRWQEESYHALTLGKDLVKAVKNKTKKKKVDKQMRVCSKRMESLMQYRKEEWPYEYQYWQGKKELK